MNNIVLGRYLPYNSFIHSLDPRTKIWAMIILLVAIFIPAGFIGYLVVGFFVGLVIIISKVPIKSVMSGFRPMLFMLVFLLIINALVIKTGIALFTIFGFTLYSGALIQTLYIVIRLVLMISVTTILTATTKPLDMTLGIEDLLKPFKRFKVPTHEISMMISIALRFIPTILEEAYRIMKAQQSRGIDLEEGKINEKLKAVLALIIPLFLCAFQRAEDLANAMEARGYNPSAKRTRFKNLKYRLSDLVAMVIVVGVFLVNLGIGFLI